MKVYKVKEQGEVTHFCFDGDVEDAKEWYVEETYCVEDEIDSIEEFPEDEWSTVSILFVAEEEHVKITLKDYMDGQKYNEIICSTAYL